MLKRNFDNFVEYISESKSIDPSIVDKVHVFQESIRFITPSSNPEAQQFDTDIINIIENLKILMRDVAVNRDKINDEMSRLERALNRRKKC
jgi:hypothetical protein